ncbi:Rieske 2Fe-2S domain-containing protein [Desmonostoc muscorum LEGE 12446]|nr:Rieske 2Fe-2S domain-containing protein [Desmonostoc muscorum]MCF2147586.1 Rieske 2Fe-2S domain-containing protein [Desmonostoc muscorum LEGE 12446]
MCLTDRCPHRTAKFSERQIIDGKIECLYHDWQFGSDGQPLRGS